MLAQSDHAYGFAGCLVNWSNYIFATILILTPSKNPESSLDSDLKLFRPTPHTKNHVIISWMRKKKKEKEKDITDNGPLMLMIAAFVIVLGIYLRSKGFFG